MKILFSKVFIRAKGLFGSFALFFVLGLFSSCSTTLKPTKHMVFASAAMKAAKRARSERRAPDLYRRAELKYWQAQRYYMVRNYERAQLAADESKRLAERAEIKAALEGARESY